MSEEENKAVETAGAARGIRKSRKGKVVSKSGDKSIVVLVERRYHHPIYGKQLIAAKKYHTHDENNEAKVGDTVEIQETRPISKLKRWRLVSTRKAAGASEGETK
jgi:30S ribosomal protein S17